MFYRFKNGTFVEADDFESAKKKLIEQITAEREDNSRNKGEVPF